MPEGALAVPGDCGNVQEYQHEAVRARTKRPTAHLANEGGGGADAENSGVPEAANRPTHAGKEVPVAHPARFLQRPAGQAEIRGVRERAKGTVAPTGPNGREYTVKSSALANAAVV